ncbi:MAG: endonuclease/exonuclease/phosphatase family protein [Alistipes finegoldii]
MSGEFYKNDYGSRRGEKPHRSLLMWLLDLVMTLLTVVVGATMAVTYFVPYVNPAGVWFFPLLGLAAPAIYVATVILALYWVIRWRLLRAGTILALVVIGLFKVSLFYKPEFRRSYGEESYDRRAFKVMTYTVRSFFGESGASSVGDVLQLIGDHNPDIICLQEFNARLAGQSDEFALLDEKYESAVFGRTQAPDSLYGAPLVILSKYRILRSGVVLTPGTSVWADLLIGDDTIRVFNNHLRSTAIKAADNDYLTSRGFLSDTAREDKLRSMAGRFRENSVLRAAQVDSIAVVVEAWRSRCIVCGDFNDTPMSYVYRTMAGGLNDAFSKSGSGYSHTFRGFFNTLRIDYVLCSDSFDPVSYEVPQVEYSDHLPVVVRLQKNLLNN